MYTAFACIPCVPPRRRMPLHTTRTLRRCRSGWGMPTLPPHGYMIAGRADRRRARLSKLNIKRAKEKKESSGYNPEKSASFFRIFVGNDQSEPRRIAVLGAINTPDLK